MGKLQDVVEVWDLYRLLDSSYEAGWATLADSNLADIHVDAGHGPAVGTGWHRDRIANGGRGRDRIARIRVAVLPSFR